MHGPNQFPEPRGLWREAVTTYMDNLTQLGLELMRGMAMSLELAQITSPLNSASQDHLLPFASSTTGL